MLRALDALTGCDPRVVVVGARADDVTALLPDGVRPVRNDDHRQGMGSSLRCGLAALPPLEPLVDAALLMLVDLPDVGPTVVGRLLAAAGPAERARRALIRCSYGGRPGHPVLIGREHWPGVLATVVGDQGARRYLREHHAAAIECGDLATGRDVDRPMPQ